MVLHGVSAELCDYVPPGAFTFCGRCGRTCRPGGADFMCLRCGRSLLGMKPAPQDLRRERCVSNASVRCRQRLARYLAEQLPPLWWR